MTASGFPVINTLVPGAIKQEMLTHEQRRLSLNVEYSHEWSLQQLFVVQLRLG